MAKERKNIIVGAANFYVTTKHSLSDGVTSDDFALPTGITTGTSAIDASALLDADSKWRDVGYTQEGVEVSYEPDYGDVEVDQLLDSARLFKQSMRVMVNTTLAEATLENLLVVWGQVDESLEDDVLDIEAGELGDEPVERGLAFVGPGPRAASAQQRIYHVERAIQTESSSHSLRRSENTGLPVSFRILPNEKTSVTAARYGTVRDRAKS